MGTSVISVSIVEDRPEMRASLAELIATTPGLKLAGAFGCMEDALVGIGDSLPDAVVVDLDLPGMSGIEGIHYLRDRYPKLPMIVLTVFDDDRRIFDAICAGAKGYLLKSAPPAQLLAGIRELIEGGAPMTPAIARRVIDLFRQFRPPEAADHNFTPHELRLLKLMAEGHHIKDAAQALGVSVNTVSFHMKNIYSKLRVHTRAEAVAKALRQGYLR